MNQNWNYLSGCNALESVRWRRSQEIAATYRCQFFKLVKWRNRCDPPIKKDECQCSHAMSDWTSLPVRLYWERGAQGESRSLQGDELHNARSGSQRRRPGGQPYRLPMWKGTVFEPVHSDTGPIGYSDNPATVTVFWSQNGSSYTDNHRIEWQSLTVTLFRFPCTVTVTDRACTFNITFKLPIRNVSSSVVFDRVFTPGHRKHHLRLLQPRSRQGPGVCLRAGDRRRSRQPGRKTWANSLEGGSWFDKWIATLTKILQGGPSGCTLAFVDIKLKVAF